MAQGRPNGEGREEAFRVFGAFVSVLENAGGTECYVNVLYTLLSWTTGWK